MQAEWWIWVSTCKEGGGQPKKANLRALHVKGMSNARSHPTNPHIVPHLSDVVEVTVRRCLLRQELLVCSRHGGKDVKCEHVNCEHQAVGDDGQQSPHHPLKELIACSELGSESVLPTPSLSPPPLTIHSTHLHSAWRSD